MNNKDIAFWIIILFIFVLGFWLVHYINTESYKCISNSMTYSIANMEKGNDANVSCICTAHYSMNNFASIIITRDGVKDYDPYEISDVHSSSNFSIPFLGKN